MSYNTVGTADEYVQSHYLSNDPTRTKWEDLLDDDKQTLLNKASSVINSLPLRGCKTSATQADAFPRCGATEVPQAVKDAEVELALCYTDTDQMEVLADYKRKADYGISSYSVGNFSETLVTYARDSIQFKYGLVSSEAQRLLTPWMNGGYCFE